MAEGTTFECAYDGFGVKRTHEAQTQMFRDMAAIPFLGKVDLKV